MTLYVRTRSVTHHTATQRSVLLCKRRPCLPHAVAGVYAGDTEPLFPGLSENDILTLYFTKPTNMPDVSTPERLWSLVNVEPVLAEQVEAVWKSVRRLCGVCFVSPQLIAWKPDVRLCAWREHRCPVRVV